MSSMIIGGTRYALEKRNLLCEAVVSNPDTLVDLKSKTLRLYCPKGKVFIVDIKHDLTGQHESPRIITKNEALEIMDRYPEGIKENVYKRYFGEPAGL